MSEIEEKIIGLLQEQLGVNREQLTPTASLIEDLGVDSLDMVEIVLAIEEDFAPIEITDAELEKCRTVGDLVSCVQSKKQ